ncbi:MAG: 16S rRNA processing protein RimM [Marinicaulis sp.]|nr:16S rRNA processing protein RimM [Marinicaulis sp.]
MTSSEENRVCIGAFAGAHGVKGAALIKTFTQSPENIAAYGPAKTEDGARSFTFRFIRTGKPGFVIVSAPEISNREDAQALKGKRLYVGRSQLPPPDEDEFYHQDLIGLDAIDENGEPIGFVKAVYNFGAGDLIELDHIPGIKGMRVAPFTKASIPKIDLAAGQVTVMREAISIDDTDDEQNSEN